MDLLQGPPHPVAADVPIFVFSRGEVIFFFTRPFRARLTELYPPSPPEERPRTCCYPFEYGNDVLPVGNLDPRGYPALYVPPVGHPLPIPPGNPLKRPQKKSARVSQHAHLFVRLFVRGMIWRGRPPRGYVNQPGARIPESKRTAVRGGDPGQVFPPE